MKMKNWTVVLLVSILAISVLIAQPKQWLHVRVTEAGEGGEKVKVNVPISLIETVLPMLEPEEIKGGKVKFDSHELTVAEMREIWKAVRSSGDYELASIQNSDMDMRISIEGDSLFVRSTEESRTHVSVTVPTAVVDALLSGTEDELNLMAAIEVLSQSGEGELVTVEDGDTKVRIWIDSTSVPAE